ncbi:hypothetical protein DL98DRAFT_81430 [Cadophora sp. DSE1049]|nr:hypothetical protein DL98DRAFT_81430 [Cadophora sp. DSE1049]
MRDISRGSTVIQIVVWGVVCRGFEGRSSTSRLRLRLPAIGFANLGVVYGGGLHTTTCFSRPSGMKRGFSLSTSASASAAPAHISTLSAYWAFQGKARQGKSSSAVRSKSKVQGFSRE